MCASSELRWRVCFFFFLDEEEKECSDYLSAHRRCVTTPSTPLLVFFLARSQCAEPAHPHPPLSHMSGSLPGIPHPSTFSTTRLGSVSQELGGVPLIWRFLLRFSSVSTTSIVLDTVGTSGSQPVRFWLLNVTATPASEHDTPQRLQKFGHFQSSCREVRLSPTASTTTSVALLSASSK